MTSASLFWCFAMFALGYSVGTYVRMVRLAAEAA